MSDAYFSLWVAGASAGAIAGICVLRIRHAFTWVTFVGGVLACGGLIVGAKLQYNLETHSLGHALPRSMADFADSGLRLPLGLLLGGALAGIWCVLLRVSWRDQGDALAVAATTMIPIGRLGCWLNGCCMGTACGTWALPLCVRFPVGTEAYSEQLRAGLITLNDPLSLPAHPLPLYFAAGSIGILLVLLWMLRRGTAPGLMLTMACALGSGGKLALETLRAVPRPPGLMFWIPTIVLVLSAAVLAWRNVRGLYPASARALARCVLVAVLAVAASRDVDVVHAAGGPAERQVARTPTPAAMEALATYARDPLKNRRLLRRLERDGTADLPPAMLLAMADARLRSKNRQTANRLFSEVLAQEPGEPWASWAHLGLGWSALLDGRFEAARLELQAVAPESRTGTFARILLAFIDAGDGKQATDILEAIAAEPVVSAPLREASLLAAAYTRYWAGDFAGAITAFEAVAVADPAGTLAGAATYGAGWSRIQAGDRVGGERVLHALASQPSVRNGPVSEQLVDLDRRAVMHAGFERYRRGPLRPPEEQIGELFDGDGPRLARAALIRLGDRRSSTASAARGSGPVHHGDSGLPRSSSDTIPPHAARIPARTEPGTGARIVLYALVVGLVIRLALRWRRARPGEPYPSAGASGVPGRLRIAAGMSGLPTGADQAPRSAASSGVTRSAPRRLRGRSR